MGRPSVFQSGPAWWQVGGVAAVLLTIAYANGLDGAFVFDDDPAIVTNESIRSLWPLGAVLWTSGDTGRTQDSRPLFNLSLALNYAAHGLWRPGFRIGNLMIHLVNVCLVFEIVRRLADLSADTSQTQDLAARYRWLAGVVALIWAVHPLHTHVITYIAQRAESLGALCILASCVLAIRALTTENRRAAIGAGVVAVLGAFAKETTIAILPLVAAFDWAWHDRLPVTAAAAGSRTVRWILYGGLMLNPVILVALQLLMGGRGHSAGFGSVPLPSYLLTQAEAVWMYVGRVFWPARLVLDHGYGIRERFIEVWPWVLLSAVFLITVAVGFARRPKGWFWAVAMLLLLAPSSSLIPVATQTIGEHRIYLASATIIAATICGIAAVAKRHCWEPVGLQLAWPVVAIVVLLAMARTAVRNRDFDTPATLWAQNVRDCPDNVRGLTNLAGLFILERQFDHAARIYRDAARIPGLHVAAAAGLGDVYRRQEKWADAVTAYQLALNDGPDGSAAGLAAIVGLAACAVHEREGRTALDMAARAEEPSWNAVRIPAEERWKLLGRAKVYRAAALRLAGNPDAAATIDGCLTYAAEHPSAAEAIARACDEAREFATAARLWEPIAARDPSVLTNLAVSRFEAGQIDAAIEAFEQAVAAYPDDPGMRANLERAREIVRRRAAGKAPASDPP